MDANKTPEWCPHCDTEVELDAVFQAQTCPNCQERILPCSICTSKECAKCPLATTILFLGYGDPLDLDVKHAYALKALDEAGFKRVEYQGDIVHVVTKEKIKVATSLIEEINTRYQTDITIDFEDVTL